jgi:hypothetical protein
VCGVTAASYPSGAESIAGKVIATIGATIKGCCNPTEPPPSCSILGIPCLGIDYAVCTAINCSTT